MAHNVLDSSKQRENAQVLDGAFIDVLGDSAASIQALLREGASENTHRAYLSAMQYWYAWHQLRFGGPLPLPSPVKIVLQFIADHISHTTENGAVYDLPSEVDAALVASGVKRRRGGLALATIRHRLAVLSEAHEIQHLPNPCRSRAVQIVMARTRSAYAKRGVRPAPKDALTREPLEKILGACDDSTAGIRDRALILFAWASGGRRRSEVVCATFSNTRRVPEGFLYTLGRSKTNQAGAQRADQVKPIVGRAAQALAAWLAVLEEAGVTSGAIFRRFHRGGKIGTRLGAESVRRIVQARAHQAGLSGDYAAHSLRSGFITEAGNQGLPLGEVMAMTGHASVASVVGYHRAGVALSSKAAHLLD